MKKFKEINDKNDPKMPLSLKNYILLLAGLIVIILGFVLMAGGGSVAAAKEKGLLRSEGKEYVVKDGDMIYFRFNV